MKALRCLAIVALLSTCAIAAEPPVLPVWPDLDPALRQKQSTNERGDAASPNRFVSATAYPLLTLHLPEGADTPTPAVVVCPGGGYAGVAINKEGHAIARWLNTLGIAGIVLQYRVPQPQETKDGTPLPLLDARQTLRLVRQNAKKWNIDPAKVGIIGFSAGGHLAATVLTRPADDPDARANFGILIYPVISMQEGVAHLGSRNNLLGKSPDPETLQRYSADQQVTATTPPTFLVHTADDPVSCRHSILYFEAARQRGASAELHLFPTGGHGYGLGAPDSAVSQWPALCASWLRSLGMRP